MGTEAWSTQVAVLLADRIMHTTLTDLGIQPDLVLGHSYGELPALLAAGAWDFETAVRITRARCDGIKKGPLQHGGMMATTATPDVIDSLIGRVEGPVYVAIHNAPDQTVLGGTDESLTQIGELLRANDFQTRMIPVPCPFHTPLMRDANGPLEEAARTANIQSPRITTYSWVTNRPVEASYEIRTQLLAHYTTPLWYVGLIRSIAAESETVFVEVGPNQICTRLHQRILGDGAAMIACDNPKRPGVQQLWQVRALLECTGALDDGKDGSAHPRSLRHKTSRKNHRSNIK
jgi:acyl transferase domain-containing protein